ncbi:uncharacterized protein PHACADRAFT_250430 [Phanerochaete carnosa HHB-10118-sp]|uniref:Btz domain-containing protein n=1 Tax=Phanerochaete carnosa (strain HHB-10118-sp) TaxID=650164 RepID=K5W714_PHACS|nr:uncharacterized protein PHACADRAFT_250430 [Phanerochaete carnosa HHB-10118-sp]EKM59738.1 hypothetical protein PHACADRAFT_250430 [Phanerochaete carnosa HHB-10118-sp]
MPATVTTPANGSTHVAKKHHTKKRIVRRRGRSALDSDDEIEREAHTDSDTDDDSSYMSESGTESASDDEHHAGIVTPSTTQSPPPLDIPGASTPAKPTVVNGGTGPFVETTDWAQIVADENTHGAGDLPVIDFADMHAHTITEAAPAAPPRSRKAHKQNKKAAAARTQAQPPVASKPVASTSETETETKQEQPEAVIEEPAASPSKTGPPREPKDSHRLRGQSARQAYQERLQHDPAFVPRVGEFWGHDDRLLDKEFRSLSGWWRGRWYGRGRGRGVPLRGRGGRGFLPGRTADIGGEDVEKGEEDRQEVPPIERPWGHDGFEEMKRREEQRREEQRRSQTSRQSASSQRGGALRGRGAFAARGRGGFSRGGGVSAASRTGPRVDPSDPTSIPVWYAQKPDKMWTKHADNFLYFEHAARPRPGEAPSIRVRLPGQKESQVVHQKTQTKLATGSTTASTATSTAEEGDRQFVVRIPVVSKIEKVSQPAGIQPVELETRTQEPSIEDVFTVRPQVVPEHVPIQASVPPSSASGTGPHATPVSSTSVLPASEGKNPLEQIGIGAPPETDSDPSADIQEAVLRNPPRPEVHAPIPQQAPAVDSSRPAPPALHPIQTSFSPVPQPSPSYVSSYPYGALPPGVGMSQQGYPYELATGRPVYLHPTPPPMYAPQPVMRSYMGHPSTSIPFVPGHVHRPSQEYMPHPHTPPVNGFVDTSIGAPIFAPARQSSRIEIRAPDGKVKHIPRPSGLRVSTTESDAEQTQATQEPAISEASEHNEQVQAAQDPLMMTYPAYQQPYYYPDPNGYSGYMDMSNQVAQYDFYPPYDQQYDQHAQPVAYY